ncbi:MAG TPA: response regulator transcription factor, partial [Bacteroidia bacterium]|nr:response regulator transcription factor [Bacteroidia bacterium]
METEKIKILLVDDDSLFSLAVKNCLTNNGYLVDEATNAKDGLDLFLKNTYHLCLLDVVMPQKDGYALAKEMKTVNKNVPIVFITSNNTKEQAIKGFNMGADAYIRKPFPMEELLVRMQAILRRSLKPFGVEHEIEKFNIGKYIFNYSAQILT